MSRKYRVQVSIRDSAIFIVVADDDEEAGTRAIRLASQDSGPFANIDVLAIDQLDDDNQPIILPPF